MKIEITPYIFHYKATSAFCPALQTLFERFTEPEGPVMNGQKVIQNEELLIDFINQWGLGIFQYIAEKTGIHYHFNRQDGGSWRVYYVVIGQDRLDAIKASQDGSEILESLSSIGQPEPDTPFYMTRGKFLLFRAAIEKIGLWYDEGITSDWIDAADFSDVTYNPEEYDNMNAAEMGRIL